MGHHRYGYGDMVITSTIYSDNIIIFYKPYEYDLNSINNSLRKPWKWSVQLPSFFCLSNLLGSSTGMSFNGTLDQWFVRGGYFNLFHFHIEMTWLHNIDQKLQG